MNINDNPNIQFIIIEYYYAKRICFSIKYTYVRLEIYILHLSYYFTFHFS